jgi:hypothetical protein
MATIERVGSKWRVRQFRDGKLQTVASCSTKPDALQILRRIEDEEAARGRVMRGSQVPMTEILARWRAAKVADGNDPLHTAAAEVRLKNLAERHNWQTTGAVTALAVSDYRKDGGSPRTCAFLAGVLRWARDTLDQHVEPKALLALRAGKSGRRPSPVLLTSERVAAIEELAGRMSSSAGTLVHCLATYGWRPITAARMVVADFDAVGGTITCRVKGGDVVRHLLLPETITRLRWRAAEAKPQDPLFIDPRTMSGWALSGSYTISQWSRDHLRAKVYDLKRYAISTMLSRGVPPQDVAQFTGHRTISQVLRYARTNEQRQRETLAALGKSLESAPEVVGGQPAAPL